MKTSTILLSLLILNSSVMLGQFTSFLFGYLNPAVMIGGEILLIGSYYVHQVIRDVRNAFDVKISM